MLQTDSQEHTNNDLEKRFLQNIHPIIPKVVGQACVGLDHYPSQIELYDFVQEIIVLLLEDDWRVLRSFGHRSKPQTWLYTIARRHILHRLQERSKMESLDDILQDSTIFIFQPDQEKKLLAKEKEAILLVGFSKLTKHDRKLLVLWLQGRSIGEIAKELRIKKESVSREIIAVTNKLQRIIREDHEI
jgi:RNA polymerase sigma factor (sigma-70 family)